MSEEFGGALPSQILAELARVPAGFLEQVVEYRAYAATKQRFDYDPKVESEMLLLVKEITGELGEEAIARQREGQ